MENNCAFCDRTQFEERLIGETPYFWIIATIGQTKQGGYLLVIPKRHVPCIGAMEEHEILLLCELKQRIYSALGYINEGSPLVIFEHGIAGQSIKHAHLHIVPVKCDITERVRRDFWQSDISQLPVMQTSWQSFIRMYKIRNEPYLLWKDSGIGIKVCWNPKNTPPQYFRNIIFEAIGQPELADWRRADPEEDKKIWSETVKKLKPHFKK